MTYSEKWKSWKAFIDLFTCLTCRENNGKIYAIDEKMQQPPVHPNCRCIMVRLKALSPGKATNKGIEGADWFIKYHGILPNYYITKENAKALGWVKIKGNLSKVAPDKMLYGGRYYDDDRKLPYKPGRIWYEADINYTFGYRNKERIVFSNDGLIFVTYDHYETFVSIE